jgi:hypothetical protein
VEVQPTQQKQQTQKRNDIPKPVVPEKEVDKKISTYNGGETEKYNWSQSIKNVDVQVPLPKGTTSR